MTRIRDTYTYSINYAKIKYSDTADGPGFRIALYVSGCTRHCHGCHNVSAWDFNSGFKLTTKEISNIIYNLEEKYYSGFSILGGEPLEKRNREDVFKIIEKVHEKRPKKTIWLWTSYTWEEIIEQKIIPENILNMINVIVDGPYVEQERNLKLKFRGSNNQRLIDVKESLTQKKAILWEDNENNMYS